MKNINLILLVFGIWLMFSGCDDNFEEINTDPFAINEIDPALLFAGAQRTFVGDWEAEHTVVQQFVNPFNDGATLAFNFNANIDNFQNGSWNSFTGGIKEMTHVLFLLGENPERINLQSMTRIWKAQAFMNVVDHYGDIPYFNAGYAAISGSEAFFPQYDSDEAIYEDLRNEIHEAVANLDPNADFVSADLFYGTNGSVPTAGAGAQVEKWRKLGNSLLLRLGMRYTKVDPSLAQIIVGEAVNGPGGVMTSNDDNAFVIYDGTLFINDANNNLINNNPRFYYAAEPFVDQLKTTDDPRSKYIIADFDDPNNPLGDPDPNTDASDQFGLPVGVIGGDLTVANGYRGPKQGGFNYSQMNVNVAASIAAPTFWVTYAQTSLLLAEAAQRGWVTDKSAQEYYEDGIRADMEVYDLYLTETGSSLPEISVAEQDEYLSDPQVDFSLAGTNEEAFDLINTQYWIVNIRNGSEAFANIRRSGYPDLERNDFNDNLLSNGGDGFVHRFSYPDAELSRNKENYQAAVQSMGGTDDLVSRVFWDN